MTGRLSLRLVVFALITALVVIYVGLGLIGVHPLQPAYHVTVLLPESGGVFPNSDVTYRGVTVGKVRAVRLRRDGVAADLAIDHGVRVPADTEAVVADLSPVGEQYLDFRPRRRGPPYLHDGSTLPAHDTRTPLPVSRLLVDLDRFDTDLNSHDVGILVGELAAAYSGTGGDLQSLLDGSSALVQSLQQALPATVDLLRSGGRVLDTTAAHAGDLRVFSAGLAAVAARLRGSDPDIRRLLHDGAAASREIDGLLRTDGGAATVLLGNLATVSQIAVVRVPALEETLVALPRAGYALASAVRGNVGRFTMVDDNGPACDYRTPRRTPQDASPRSPDTSGRCHDRAPDEQQRGAQNAPPPSSPSDGHARSVGARPTVDQALTTTAYDPVTGVVDVPGASDILLGADGGAPPILGDASWLSLLVALISP